MYPSAGHVGGGEVVTLSSKQLAAVQNIPGAELTCKFDNEFVRAYYVDAETVKCTAPSHTEGFVNVEFALNNETGDFLRTKGYQFVSGAKVDAVNSVYGISGGIVDVFGADMHVSQYCRFGDLTTTGHIVSSGLMKCESPSIDKGTVAVDVSLTSSNFFEAFSSVQHIYIGAPSISRVSPAVGTGEGGTLVTLTGQNFAPTSLLRCRFGAIEVSAIYQNENTLECATPASSLAAKPLSVSMNHRDYVTFSNSFTFLSSLVVDAIAPFQVSSAGSSHVSITVQSVVQTPELACKFGSHKVPGLAGTNAVTCVAPAGIGFVSVAVASNGQDFQYSVFASDSVQLELKDVIEITRIAPRVGAIGGGTLVHIEGEHLLQDNPVCRFGTTTVAATHVSSALMICETPSMFEGAYALDVSVVATAVELAMKPQFLFDPPPVVTALSPSMGLVEGGTTVTAAGHSFSDSHDLACKFGSIGPVVGEWIAADEYRCLAPAHVEGWVNFDIGMVSEFGAMFADGPQVTFLYTTEASVTTIINNDNNTATVTGTGFVPGQDVYCNLGNGDALVPGIVLSDGSVLCGLPEDNNGVNEYDIRIVDSSGNNIVSSTDANDILTRKVLLDHLLPLSGPSIGGTAIVVYGDHFSPSSLCRFGTLAPFRAVFISPSQVMCESPSMEVGYHDLAVSNNAFDWSVPGLPFEFMNTSSSVIHRVVPKTGPSQGGTILSFDGLAFRNDVSLAFRIGTISNVLGRWLSMNAASCVSPAHSAGSVPVNVFHHNTAFEIKLSQSAATFEYKVIATLSSMTIPESSFVTGGTSVTLFGENFYGSHLSCRFGSTTTNAFIFGSNTVCNAPASKSGFTVIDVSMNLQDFTSSALEFHYVAKPKLMRATPLTFPTIGGSLVYVTGSNMIWGGTNYSASCGYTTSAGTAKSSIHVISSALVVCVTPEGKDDTALQLVYNDVEQSADFQITFILLPGLETDHPAARGLEAGGAVVDIYGDFSTDLSVISCKVGTISGISLTQGSSEKVECILPAHSPATVPVTVAMNERDNAATTLLYEYIANIDLTEPYRTSVSLDGGSLVELMISPSTLPSSLATLPVACVFDLHAAVAKVESNGLVLCLAPAHSSGFVAVGVQIHDVSVWDSSQIQLSYEPHAQITNLQPYDGAEAGGEIIKLTGVHFNEVTHNKFVFGSTKFSPVQFVSSALVVIEQPANDAGSAVLSFLSSGSTSLTDDEFESSGIVFEYIKEEDNPLHVSPQESNEDGGSIAIIYYKVDPYQQSFDNCACKFGSLGPIIGQLTGNGLECRVPAHIAGTIPMYARLFGEMFTSVKQPFSYHETVEVSSSAVYPSFGSVSGGVAVRILHENPMETSIKCHVAGFFVSATSISTNPYVSECIMPAYAPGFAQISLGASPGKDETDSLFLFQPDPILVSAYPTLISNSGGELVTISGEDLLDVAGGSVQCYFGDVNVPAKVHSSTLVTCESPYFSNNQGRIALYVDTGGSLNYDEMGTTSISYIPAPTLLDISAETVATSGGDTIQISSLTSVGILEELVDAPAGHVGSIGPMYVRSSGSSFEFVTPAHSPTSPDAIRVWLSSHLTSSYFTNFVLIYSEEDMTVMHVVPGRASNEGLADVVLEATGHSLSSTPKGCMFGLFPVLSSQAVRTSTCSGGNQRDCVRYTLSCPVPILSAGFVELSTIGLDGVGVDFDIFVPPVVTSMVPSVGFYSGSSVIHVAGEHLHESSFCHFGDQNTTAYAISSALSVCTSPVLSGNSPMVSLGVSPRDDENYVSEIVAAFQYLDDFDFLSQSLENPYLSEDGGNLFTFHIGNLAEDATEQEIFCRFGTIGPISTSEQRSSTSVTCISPAGLNGTVVVGSLTYNSKDYASVGSFEYFTPLVPSFVSPKRSVAAGDTTLKLMSNSAIYLPHGAYLGCKLHGQVAQATFEDQRTITCDTPPSGFGFTVLEIMVLPDAATPIGFEVFMPPVVLNVHPSIGTASGTTVLHVDGDNLHESGYCYFGNEQTSAHVVSSALGLCITPPWSTERRVGIGMAPRDDPGFISSYGTAFEYIDDLMISAVSPETGSENGGTTLSVSVNGLTDGARYSCRIGTFFPITSYNTQSDVLTCITPARGLGIADISISGNDRDLSTINTATFVYQVPPKISGIIPKVGLSGSRSPIFITGSNFVNTSSLTCRFGQELATATFLSSRSILCVAGVEQSGTRTVFVEVSTNGVDFSEQRLLFHFAQCPSGSYCPESEAILCPRGAFCGGGKNFTLCPPGTFQPRTGQADCLPTPVGYISPDAGSMIPIICPRGAVCDSTGLTVPNKLCPPGHYCLEGTRTSNFTDFTVAERPLPCPFGMYCTAGVVSSASIAYNFTTPQQCYAGYVCEPGSITPQGVGPCPPGHYCPPGQQLRCPKRMYCPGVANAEPKPCLPGEYNSDYGKDSCQKCPKGTICPGFAREAPEVCTPGFVCDTEGLAVAGTRCPAGHYCLENTVTRDPLAIIDVAAIVDASPIALNVDNFRPKPCPPTTFCTEGVTTSIVLEGSFKQPQPCKEGSFCEWATGDSTVVSESATDVYNPMRPCTEGHYCPKRTYIPIPAPRGSYTSGQGNSAAVTCLPGTYTPYEGFQECLTCAAGYECVDEGTFKPTACPAGYFRSARDSIACRQCPKGTWSSSIGLTEESLCLPCNSGLVCAIDGMSNNKPRGQGTAALNEYSAYCDADNTEAYDASKCVLLQLDPEGEADLCPEGYVCDARTSIAEQKCPDGYFCGPGTTPETQFFNKCPAGYYCPAGASYSTRTQFPCQACFFCPTGTGQVLNRCPTGTASSPSAQSLDECSADLITFWRVMPVSFDLIEKTYYKTINATGRDTEWLREVESQIAAGRTLLQIDTTNTSSSNATGPTDPFDYMGMGSCTNKNWELLNPTFILSDDNSIAAVDENNIPLMKFTLPRGHTAKLRLDWRTINENLKYGEHYELLIFTNPVIDDTLCPASEYKSVPCPPWDVGDGITWLNMKVIAGEEQEKKCPASQESLELPFWFARNSDGTATGYNVENPTFGNYVWKRGMHELSIQALDDLPFRIELRMLDGRYQEDNRASFLNSICIDVEFPERASATPTYSVHAILPFEIDEEYQAPLNAPVASTMYRSVSTDYFECANINQDPGCRRLDARAAIDYNSTYGAEWKKFKYLRQQNVLTAEDSPSQAHIDLTSTQAEDWVIVNEDGQTDETITLSLPDVYEQEKYLLNEGLWAADQTLFAMDYLPFFSACRGFDSHIFFSHLTENPYKPVTFGEDRTFVSYGETTLVPKEETVFINQYSPQVQAAVADELELTIDCFYEEAYTEASAKKRWYEAEGDTLFYLTAEAESQDALFEASALANDQTEPAANKEKYMADITAQENIPVIFAPVEGFVLTAGLMPTKVEFEILYYQFTDSDKRIIAATVTMDEYVSATAHDGTYTLSVAVSALGWFDLLNFFAFDFLFYLALFFAIGMLVVLLIFSVWVVVRIFTLLKEPPRFRFLPYLRIMIGPPLMGVTLGMLPFATAQFGLRAVFVAFPIITEFPISIDNIGREIDPAVVEKATAGRYAVCFLTAGMYMMGCAAEILVPAELKDEEEKELEDERYVDEVMFKPEVWKRSHFVLMNILVNVTNVFLIEFSFTDTFGVQFFTIFFLLKVAHVIMEMQIETALGEAFLLAPVSVVLASAVGVATIGADDFTDFTLGFFFETIMGMVEYVYLDAFIAYCALVLPDKISAVVNYIMNLLPFNFGDDDDVEVEEKIDAEDTLVEDLMGFLAAYGVNTAVNYMTPFFIFFFWDFNDQLRLSYLYGFRKKDLLIYLLFSVVIIPFWVVMDIITFNIQELFHGWKVYEYLKYARYRFINRTSRWKGFERVYDESIDPGLRAIDQMCFSSQFYFVLALGGSGSFLFVLALSMMLRANYNMFEDILFWACVLMVLGASYTAKRLALLLANHFGLWRITSSITSGEIIIEDSLDEDFSSIFVPKMAAVIEDSGGDSLQTMDVTTADLTSDQFRHLFMSKNRDWVIDQLQEILSPRTARRLKLGKAVRRRMKAGEMSESDSDMEEDFGEVKLSVGAEAAMRIWLTHAASRASGRGVNLRMLSDTSESETEAGLQRFPPVNLSEASSAALTGWLAAVKQLRANRQSSLTNTAVFSSTDFSSESDTDTEPKYATTEHMSQTSKMVMRDWLTRAREMRASVPPSAPKANLSDDSGDSSSQLSSDSASPERQPVSYVAASVMSQWLQRSRAEKEMSLANTPLSGGPKRQALTSDSGSSSDLESSDDPELAFDTRRPKTLSTASASILTGWLSSAQGVFRRRSRAEARAGSDEDNGSSPESLKPE